MGRLAGTKRAGKDVINMITTVQVDIHITETDGIEETVMMQKRSITNSTGECTPELLNLLIPKVVSSILGANLQIGCKEGETRYG